MPTHADSAASRSDLSDTFDSAIENAFARIPRPQRVLDLNRPLVPTKLSLQQARADTKAHPQQALRLPTPPPPPPPPPAPPLPPPSSPVRSSAVVVPSSPPVASTVLEAALRADLEHHIGPVVTLGTFAQDGVEWAVRAQRGRSGLIMVKRLERAQGLKERHILDEIKHKNIVQVIHTYWEGDFLCLALEYCRVTLAEILHVHLRLEGQHVQHIARSIFDALAYLSRRGITHHKVGTRSIRVTVPDLRIVLASFEHATRDEPQENSHCDLNDLGIVLLECMEGHLLPTEMRQLKFIRAQRAMNRVFGLTKPEKWSGCKTLIDFLDDLFNEERTAFAKLSKPHKFVSSKRDDGECMRPYVELVTLECFTLWTAAK